MAEYSSHVGVRELTGRNDGPAVERFLAATGLPKGHPWCAAFVRYCFDQINVKTTITAWSPTSTPRHRMIWHKGKVLRKAPEPGDVFSIYYANLRRIGHTGFVDGWPEGSPYAATVEGNTNAQNSREGNGCYRRIRLKRNLHAVADWLD